MKVKDYYAKYKERLNSEDEKLRIQGSNALIFDFIRESNQVMEDRKISTNEEASAMVNEFNDKWNELAKMFKGDVLKRDGWRTYIYLCKLSMSGRDSNGE